MVQAVDKKFAAGKDPREGQEDNREIKKEEHVEARHSTSTLAPTAFEAVEVAPAVDPNAPVKRGRGRPRGSKSKKRERTEAEEEVLQGPDFKENGSHSNMLLLADVISTVRQRKAPKWINFGEDDSYRNPTRQSRSQSTARPKAPGAYKPWQAYGIPKGMPETAEKHFIGSYFTKEEAAEAVRVFEEGRQPILSFNAPRKDFPPATAPYHLLDPDLTPYRKAYDEGSIPGVYRRKDGYWTATGTRVMTNLEKIKKKYLGAYISKEAAAQAIKIYETRVNNRYVPFVHAEMQGALLSEKERASMCSHHYNNKGPYGHQVPSPPSKGQEVEQFNRNAVWTQAVDSTLLAQHENKTNDLLCASVGGSIDGVISPTVSAFSLPNMNGRVGMPSSSWEQGQGQVQAVGLKYELTPLQLAQQQQYQNFDDGHFSSSGAVYTDTVPGTCSDASAFTQIQTQQTHMHMQMPVQYELPVEQHVNSSIISSNSAAQAQASLTGHAHTHMQQFTGVSQTSYPPCNAENQEQQIEEEGIERGYSEPEHDEDDDGNDLGEGGEDGGV